MVIIPGTFMQSGRPLLAACGCICKPDPPPNPRLGGAYVTVGAGQPDPVERLAGVPSDFSYFNTCNSLPTFTKASMQRSSCSTVWPADTCTRMRARPFGTTG